MDLWLRASFARLPPRSTVNPVCGPDRLGVRGGCPRPPSPPDAGSAWYPRCRGAPRFQQVCDFGVLEGALKEPGGGEDQGRARRAVRARAEDGTPAEVKRTATHGFPIGDAGVVVAHEQEGKLDGPDGRSPIRCSSRSATASAGKRGGIHQCQLGVKGRRANSRSSTVPTSKRADGFLRLPAPRTHRCPGPIRPHVSGLRIQKSPLTPFDSASRVGTGVRSGPSSGQHATEVRPAR